MLVSVLLAFPLFSPCREGGGRSWLEGGRGLRGPKAWEYHQPGASHLLSVAKIVPLNGTTLEKHWKTRRKNGEEEDEEEESEETEK